MFAHLQDPCSQPGRPDTWQQQAIYCCSLSTETTPTLLEDGSFLQASQQSDSAICEQPEMPHMLHVKCITIRQVLALLLKVGVHDSKGNEAS